MSAPESSKAASQLKLVCLRMLGECLGDGVLDLEPEGVGDGGARLGLVDSYMWSPSPMLTWCPSSPKLGGSTRESAIVRSNVSTKPRAAFWLRFSLFTVIRKRHHKVISLCVQEFAKKI